MNLRPGNFRSAMGTAPLPGGERESCFAIYPLWRNRIVIVVDKILIDLQLFTP